MRPPTPVTRPNADAIEAWNTVLFDKFLRFQELVTVGLGHHGHLATERLDPRPGERIVDLGCGFGDTTLDLARRVGPDGEAVGIDGAPRFVEAGGLAAAQAGVHNARFRVADVQTDDLGGPYDAAFSRMGTMFFASPVAAMRNVRRALRPGGRLAIAVWRRRDDNPFVYLAERAVDAVLPREPVIDAPTCGPGPFSMADADTVTAQLQTAGFQRVALERHDAPVLIGRSLDDAIAFAMALGPAGERVRLAGDEGERRRDEVVASLRAVLAPLVTDEGVLAGSSAWVVTARA